jgi:hypothetical protein
MKTFIYVVQTGSYETNFVDSVFLIYDEAKSRAMTIVEEINKVLEEEHNNMKELALYQDVPKEDIPPLTKIIEVEENYWSSDVDWVSIEKHLLR